MRPIFSRALIERTRMTSAAEKKFRAEATLVSGFDLGAADVLVVTAYHHPDGRILIDNIKSKPKCALCQKRPARGGKRQGCGLCQECYDQDSP